MSEVRYEMRFNGLSTSPGTIRLSVLHGFAEAIIQGAERTLRLAIEGRSVKRGKQPDYIQDSVNFVLSGLASGSTVVYLDVPTLRETALSRIQQLDFWDRSPKPEDTALTLLSVAVEDASADRYDSDHYDAGVLGALVSTKSFFEHGLQSVEIRSLQTRHENIRLDGPVTERFEKIKKGTPDAQSVIISGKLDLIEHSTRSYKLRLATGLVLQGSIDESLLESEQLRTFWGKDVTIKGTLFFRPSGAPRHIEAQVIRPYAEQDSLFTTLPDKENIAGMVSEMRRKYKGASVLNEMWGQWPGDEPIKQLLELLRKE